MDVYLNKRVKNLYQKNLSLQETGKQTFTSNFNMPAEIDEHIKIINTTKKDFPEILWVFKEAIKLQEQNGYKVWEKIDKAGLRKDIENRLQYKILKADDILCVFSMQFKDPFIWRSRDKNDAIYLHRIVVNPNFKGEKQFAKILGWAIGFCLQNNLKFIRMDTWADNKKLIDYYRSFGFRFIENYVTTNAIELPIQNRNLNVALLEFNITDPKRK